jgi:hypothetical protein
VVSPVELAQKSPECIEVLENLLDLAKQGEILSVAVAFAGPAATTGTVFHCHTRPVAMLGEIRLLERDIIDVCVDTRMHESGTYY